MESFVQHMVTDMESRLEVECGSSPASRGAAGAYIEGELGALYLLSLLTGNRAPGLPDVQVTSVRFQGTEQGFKLDDVVVFGVGPAGDSILEIQSKRDITFSPGDSAYQDVALQIARSELGAVPADRHLLGIATQRTSRKICGAYQDVLKWARALDSAVSFFSRLNAKGVASKDMRDFVATTRKNLIVGGVADNDDAIWRLLRRIVILEFDFEAESPLSRTYGIALARMALADEDAGRAEALWSRLVDLSVKTGTTGGEVDRTTLKANLSAAGFLLAGDRDYGAARARLAELSQNTLSHIGATVSGVNLPRLSAIAAIDDACESFRFVEVCGAPGVGKSWILRHLAERSASRAPIIFLDREATPPGGWLSFANALGIPGSAAEFLTDLAASGGAMLFIDGLDMFDDAGCQRTIAELVRAASEIPEFRVIVTKRMLASGDFEFRLDDEIIAAMGGAHPIEVDPLSDEDVEILVDQAPEVRSLLDPTHPAVGLTRNLYRLSRLLKVPSATGIRTEAAMARLWWSSADGASANDVRAAQRLMAAVAKNALKGEKGLEVSEDSKARLHLIERLTFREVQRDRLDFWHDVLRDWAIGSYIAEQPQRLADLDLSVPISPRVARGVEFAARLILESGKDCSGWLLLLRLLSANGAHGSWRRQAILALTRSEAGYEMLGKSSLGLLADEAALLIEVCTTIIAVETVATVDLMTMPGVTKVDLPRSHRTDVTGAAMLVLRWVLVHVAEIPMSAINAVVDLVKVQLSFITHLERFAQEIAAMLFSWLRQLDVRDATLTIPDERQLGWGVNQERSNMIEQLRSITLLFGKFAPDELKAYLREIGNERDRFKADAIRQFSAVIAPVAPAELVGLVLGSLLQKKRNEHRDRMMTQAFTFADSNYLPASPAQPPFLELLKSAPHEGLKLIRTLVAESVAFSSDRSAEVDGFTVDLGDGPRFFPRTDTYLWSREQCRDYSAASGLKALEAWSQQRLDDGVPVNEVLADIIGPRGSCAAYLLVAVDVLLSHFKVARDALAPFIADPELLATDRMRRDHDQLGFGIDQFTIGKEPQAEVGLADLRGRPSRQVCLFDIVCFYLNDDPVANRLREHMAASVATLEPIQPYSNWSDARLIARVANNMLQPSNWIEAEDGKLNYRSPADEAAHLSEMEKRQVEFMRSTEIEARIDLAITGRDEHATSATARDAVMYAGGDLPDDRDTDYLKSRSTRLISTALLAARDGDNALIAAEEPWIRKVIAIALEEHSDRVGGSGDSLRFNRPAMAILALIHLWARKPNETDRNLLIRLATRHDGSAVSAFSAGIGRILSAEPRVFKAAMRAAFAGMTWRWKSYDDEDETEQARFNEEQSAALEIAVLAEVAWLDGGTEPLWPTWPDERPQLRRRSRIRLPRLASPKEPEDTETADSGVVEPPNLIHIDSKTAAKWLEIIQISSTEMINWRQEVVDSYAGWTGRMNGLNLPIDIEIENSPHEWNLSYYSLFAERLLDASDATFETELKLVADLPDAPFGDVAQTVIHAADALYFNHQQRSAERIADLRAHLAKRVMELQRWRHSSDPASSRIDMESGGIVAKMMLNTYDPFNGTRSYLPAALFDRVDPLLPSLRPLLPGGPTAFVALCTMNLLLVSTRVRHLNFLLEATEAWFDRTHAPSLWIDLKIGRKVVQWLEAVIVQEPEVLAPAYPSRARIDRMLGRLVAVGIAEAHEIELKVEGAAWSSNPD